MITNAMCPNFPSVFIADVPRTFNSVIVATNLVATITASDIQALNRNLLGTAIPSQMIQQVGQNVLQKANLHEWTQTAPIFTDAHAPVEQLIDQIILDYVVGGGKY
jgi:hypothetical protein